MTARPSQHKGAATVSGNVQPKSTLQACPKGDNILCGCDRLRQTALSAEAASGRHAIVHPPKSAPRICGAIAIDNAVADCKLIEARRPRLGNHRTRPRQADDRTRTVSTLCE